MNRPPRSRLAATKGSTLGDRIWQRSCACGASRLAATDRCERCAQRVHDRALDATTGGEISARVDGGMRSNGRPLDAEARAWLEPRLGYDFSRVRVHTDGAAAESARALSAEAYTVGTDITFQKERYSPATRAGLALLAHELTHVAQQGGANRMVAQPGGTQDIVAQSIGALNRRFVTPLPDEPLEREARLASAAVARGDGTMARVSPAPRGVQRAQSQALEMLNAIVGIGPRDAWVANALAKEATARAADSGLKGIHNGDADAWRHCYWNCRMAAELGAGQANVVAQGHERYGTGPANENLMDAFNNGVGQACGPGSCDQCCQSHLDAGELRVIDSRGAVIPSGASGRVSDARVETYPGQ